MNKKLFLLCITYIILFSIQLPAQDTVHTLQKGETLYSLSRLYSVTVDEICILNNISDSSKVYVGQKLIIKKGNDSKTEIKGTSQKQGEKYTVLPGDTLYGIARIYSVSIEEIKKLNNFTESSILKSGQVILIPDQVTSVAKEVDEQIITTTNVSLADPRVFETKQLDSSIIWPIRATELHYLSGKVNGVLLTGKKGEKVTCIASGTVMSIGPFRGFGQVAFIKTQAGFIYVYAGLDSIDARKGDWLNFGDTIGMLGTDSLSGKPQLNLMVYEKDTAVDPAKAPRG